MNYLGLLFVSILFFGFQPISDIKEIEHEILVLHPGKNETEAVEVVLVERQHENGETLAFFMDVESVICTNNKCKVVAVRIFWDIFGNYDRIALEKDIYLEKYNGEAFSDKDYVKLNEILKNRNADLADYSIEEILEVEQANETEDDLQDIDAISGATIAAIAEDQTVKGATLTCYTLWHWANGGVTDIIQSIFFDKIQQTLHCKNM